MNNSKNIFFIQTLPILLVIFGMSYWISGKQFPIKENINTENFQIAIFKTWKNNQSTDFKGIPAIEDSLYKTSTEHIPQSIHINNTHYFISHPPFSYYLGYLFYLLFNENWTVLKMILSFISAFFIYSTVSVLCFHQLRSSIHLPSLFAFVIYLTNPFVMKLQISQYHPDILVQTEFIVLTYIALKMIMRKKMRSFKYLLTFSILNFLMVYTSWVGILFSITIALYGLFNLRKGYGFFHILLFSLFTMLIAVSLMTMQYSQIGGLTYYLKFLKANYIQESGIWYLFYAFKSMNIFHSIAYLIKYYFLAYWVIYLSMFIFILFSITGVKKKILFTKNGYRYIVLSSFPVMLSHIVLMKYSLGSYSILYALAFLSVVMGILFEKIEKTKVFEPIIFYTLSSIIIIAQLIQGCELNKIF